ncbi:hypothetical protein, partial [Staphylococcus epidermidis]|uniref:hypothetical protein n=1 Tax=Staphylococcus epidermidis TaxID=1282 RepID=UPI001C92CD84
CANESGTTGKNREWLRREWKWGEMEVEWIGVGSEVVKDNCNGGVEGNGRGDVVGEREGC